MLRPATSVILHRRVILLQLVVPPEWSHHPFLNVQEYLPLLFCDIQDGAGQEGRAGQPEREGVM